MAQDDWQDLLREASRLRALGQVEEAIAAYQQLLAAKPDLPDSWYNLGWLQRRARRFDAALDSYQRALDRGVREPEEVHLNRAVIFSDHLHRPEHAARELNAALSHNPEHIPALLNLGNLREDQGDPKSARDAYERALRVDPANSLALARFATLAHSSELDAALAARVRTAISLPGAAPVDQADLGFALAGMLDAAGQYDEAFRAATSANAASRAAAGPSHAYNRAGTEAFIDRIIGTFDHPRSRADSASLPVFICGLFRSGSTLTEQMLGAHSQVRASGELDLLPALVERIDGYPEAVANVDPATLGGWREFYLNGLPVAPRADLLVTDKRPDNFLHIGLIKALFPAAKIVHTRRDALDNLLSLYFLHLDPGLAYALDLDDAAHWYGQYARLMAHWQSLYPNDIFDVDYDALVRRPRAALEPLLAFLGLSWEDGVLDFHRGSATVKTASVWQVRQPLHGRSSGRWRNYQAQLEPIAARLAEGRVIQGN